MTINLPLRSSLSTAVRSAQALRETEEGRRCVTVNNYVPRINYPCIETFQFHSSLRAKRKLKREIAVCKGSLYDLKISSSRIYCLHQSLHNVVSAVRSMI